MLQTYYERWINNDPHTKGIGSFLLSLMETYKLASGTNRRILETAFPDYFVHKS